MTLWQGNGKNNVHQDKLYIPICTKKLVKYCVSVTAETSKIIRLRDVRGETDDQGEEQRNIMMEKREKNKQKRWLNWQLDHSRIYDISIELFGRNKGRVCLQYVWVLDAQGHQEPGCVCLCVCEWVGVLCSHKRETHTHTTGTRCSLLANGLFSMEPKAQPSANIRKAQGQHQWIGGSHSHLLANTHTKHINGHVIQRLRFMLAFLSLLHFLQVLSFFSRRQEGHSFFFLSEPKNLLFKIHITEWHKREKEDNYL